jgi:hypothetical protein
VALLYFVAGAIFLHEHTSSAETVCPICQALHMPALAFASVDLTFVAHQAVWHAAIKAPATPCDSFALHRAPRAPPTA